MASNFSQHALFQVMRSQNAPQSMMRASESAPSFPLLQTHDQMPLQSMQQQFHTFKVGKQK